MAASPLAAAVPSGLEHRTRHKIALRLLPFLFILYIVNYVDRTNLGFAAIGMERDLGFSDRVFGLGAGIFFASYMALQIPGALLVERWSARRVISACMIAWGMLTLLTGLVQTPWQLYAARLVLGAAEASFFPGVIVYLSHWFQTKDRAKATSNFMAAIPISFVIGSPIAGWIISHNWLGVSGWRWLFVAEGIPAILLGAVAFFYLTDQPAQANWLKPEERAWMEERLRLERGSRSVPAREALRSLPVLVLAAAYFMNNPTSYVFMFWYPTMLKRMANVSDLRIGLLGAVPFAACFVAMQVNGWHSDRQRERKWHATVPLLIAVCGWIGLARGTQSIGIAIVFFTLVALGTASISVFFSMPTEILSQAAAAAAVGIISTMGNISSFLSPYLFGYLRTRTGSFTAALWAV
ncbi:MAG TPA: MFS transporter, partial [Terriglobales bacterium]|nr:MFS transporter [Terriglobales bacterium]